MLEKFEDFKIENQIVIYGGDYGDDSGVNPDNFFKDKD